VTIPSMDMTHDPQARSWLPSANESGCAFPLQNLPFSVFRHKRSAEGFRGGVAIGNQIIDLCALADTQLFTGAAAEGVSAGSLDSLNSLMRLGPRILSELRRALFEAMSQGSAHEALLKKCLVP
jgi:fumarylacetoacetase